MITAMILAGGNGTRVGADRPKQFVEILGKPILAYTVEIYQKILTLILLKLYAIRTGLIMLKIW